MNKDRYKIYEHSTHTELIPIFNYNKNESKLKYTHVMFFFAGFNEYASKYIYLFKNFLEDMQNISIKVIIPNLPTYNTSDLIKYSENPEFNQRFPTIRSWFRKTIKKFDNKILNYNNTQEYKNKYYEFLDTLESAIDYNTTEFVKKYIIEEAYNLNSSEKIILAAFSQGGIYLLNSILNNLNIKVCFIALFKTNLVTYVNPMFYYNEKFINDNQFNKFKCNYNLLLDKNLNKTDLKNFLNKNFLDNHIYYHVSRYDKIVTFQLSLDSYNVFNNEFKVNSSNKSNLFFSCDNSNKHEVDSNCLRELAKLFNTYILNNLLVKF